MKSLLANLRAAILDTPTRVRLIRIYAVPAFLVIVASIHMYRVHAFDQSSWGAGCGFGMFATVDYHGSRFYRCWVHTSEGQIPAQFKPDFARLDLAGRVVPSEENLRILCNQLARSDWHRLTVDWQSTDANVNVPTVFACTSSDWQPPQHLQQAVKYSDSRPLEVNGISLELWGVRIDQREKQLSAFLKQRVELGLAE